MRAIASTFGFLLTLLMVVFQVKSAPAPVIVTLWQTITQDTAPTSTLIAVVPDTPVSLPVSAATVASAQSSPAFTSTPSSSTPSSSTSSAFGLNDLLQPSFWSGLLDSFFGRTSASSSSVSPSTSITTLAPVATSDPVTASFPSANAAANFGSSNGNTAASAALLGYVATLASSPAAVYSSSTSVAASPASTSNPVATGGIYDAIADSDVNATFAKQILDRHNEYRKVHQVAPLSWEVSAYNYAKNNADNYDCSGILTHTHGPFGENLAAGFSDGSSAVDAWYVEGETYSYSNANTYDHFTQVVWKDSTKVGCAYKDCRAENWGLYIICSYDPPGNVIGENEDNVFPATS